MKTITAILIVLFPILLSAQWTDITREEFGKIIRAMDQKMSQKQSISYEAKQFFFKSAERNDTVTTMNFKYKYIGELGILNMHQFNSFKVQDSVVSIRIDTTEQIMVLEKANPELTQFNLSRNFSDFYNTGAKVQKNTTSKETIYKVKFDTLALFSTMTLWVNQKGDITKYSLIAGRPIQDTDADEQKLIYPRLDVYISNIKSGKEVSSNGIITPLNFFTDVTFTALKPEYESFELMDSRKNKDQK